MSDSSNPRWVAFLDVDGTLMDRDSEKPGARELLALLEGFGVVVSLASARPPQSLIQLAASMSPVSLISALNGAIVLSRECDMSWHAVMRQPIPHDTLQRGISVLSKLSVEYWWYDESQWYGTSCNYRTDEESRAVGMSIQLAPSVHEAYKILCFPSPQSEARVRSVLHSLGLRSVSSNPGYLEVMAGGLDERKGGDAVLEWVGGSWARTVAVGDGLNDQALVSSAAYGFALGQLGSAIPERAAVDLFEVCERLERQLHCDPRRG